MAEGGVEVVLVDSFDEVEAFFRWLSERRDWLGFDLETSGLDPYRDTIRLAQFGDARTGWAIPYGDWRGVVRRVMDTYEGQLVAHNAKFDVSMLEHDGVAVPRHLVNDSMIMCHLFDSEGPRGLKQAAARNLGKWALQGEQELKLAMHRAKWDWATVPEAFEAYWMYGALDPAITVRLTEVLWPHIQYSPAAYELERDCTFALLNLEQKGARIDVDYCELTRNQLETTLAEIEARWPGLNLHSSTQVIRALEKDGVKLPRKRTAKGNQALDDEVLDEIDHPLARDTKNARRAKKLSGTYFANFLADRVGDLLHPNVNPLGARTGRMSVNRPALQTLPRKSIVRNAFIPRDGNVLVLADYQAQETRLIAHFAREEAMIEAFRNGVDIHTYVASMVYGVPMEAVEKEQRRRSKQCGHARNYGANGKKIALTAGISLGEGNTFVRQYDRKFPRIQQLHRDLTNVLHERDDGNGRGYITTYSGRRVWVHLDKAYTGANYLIQGSGADVVKRAIVNADRSGVGEYLILPVHDELVWDVPRDGVDDALVAIAEAMEPTDLTVPLPIETKVVECWGAAYGE